MGQVRRMVRRFRRFLSRRTFSTTPPPRDETVAFVSVAAVVASAILRAAARSNAYSLFWPHVPFGGVLDLFIALAVAFVVAGIAGSAAVLLYRLAKHGIVKAVHAWRPSIGD